MALTTIDRVRGQLDIKNDDTTKDVYIAECVERVSADIESRCGRTFGYQAAIVEYQSGDGEQRYIIVDRPPIVAVTSIFDDPARVYGTGSQIQAADFVITKATAGMIQLDGFRFLKGLNNIKITYDGGYKVIPQDLERAAIVLCAADFIDHKGQLNVQVDIEIANQVDRLRGGANKTIDRYIHPKAMIA